MQLHEAIANYSAWHLQRYWKQWEGPHRLCHRHLTRLPDVELAQLSRLQVIEWLHGYRRQPYLGRACLSHLHQLYTVMAEQIGYDGPNPTHAMKKSKLFPVRKRCVTVSTTKMPCLMTVLTQQPLARRVFFLTLLLCGARLNELRLARWTDLDLDAGTWDIPQPKNNEPHRLILPPELIALHRQLEQAGPWVYSHDGAHPWGKTTIERYWAKIRRRCGLEHVRIHDLRRTLLSDLCNQGQIALAQIIANHKDQSTTVGYWQRGASPQAAAALAARAKVIFGQGATA